MGAENCEKHRRFRQLLVGNFARVTFAALRWGDQSFVHGTGKVQRRDPLFLLQQRREAKHIHTMRDFPRFVPRKYSIVGCSFALSYQIAKSARASPEARIRGVGITHLAFCLIIMNTPDTKCWRRLYAAAIIECTSDSSLKYSGSSVHPRACGWPERVNVGGGKCLMWIGWNPTANLLLHIAQKLSKVKACKLLTELFSPIPYREERTRGKLLGELAKFQHFPQLFPP